MRFPQVSEVRAYWEALRNGRPVPYRSEVDPRGIERALEYAFILERIAPQVARFRLAGMHLNDLMGMEVRGMPMTAFFTPAARPQVSSVLEAVFAGPQIAELSLTAQTGRDRPAMEAKVVILPLKSDLGDVSRALGCFMAPGTIGRTPRRFDLSTFELSAIRVDPRAAAHAAPQHGFAEPAAAFAGLPVSRARSRSHLRLVVSDEQDGG